MKCPREGCGKELVIKEEGDEEVAWSFYCVSCGIQVTVPGYDKTLTYLDVKK